MAFVQDDTFAKDVGTLADGPYDVITLFGAVTGEILDAVAGMIERGPDEVVHPAVQHGKLLGQAFLDI